MKYLMSTFAPEEHYDPATFTEEKRAWVRDLVEFMHELNKGLIASGELVTAEGLDSPALTKTVRYQDGEAVVTDGPFAEAKEYLAGYWVLDVSGFDRVAEIAAQVVRYVKAPIEIRPIGSAPEV